VPLEPNVLDRAANCDDRLDFYRRLERLLGFIGESQLDALAKHPFDRLVRLTVTTISIRWRKRPA